MTGSFSAQFSGYSYGEGSVGFADGLNHFELHEGLEIFKGPSVESSTIFKRIEPGDFLLFSDQFSDVDPNNLTGSIHEPEVNELGKTRERNTHGLVFGQLILKSTSDKEKNTLVAVKPFDRLAFALDELAATEFVNSRDGRPNGFRPLGMYRFQDGAYGLITAYEPEVVSLDNIFWDEDNIPTTDQVSKALKVGAVSLYSIHVDGATHGDFQAKNAVSDNQGPRQADLATFRGFPVHADGNIKVDSAAQRIWGDVDKFISSLNSGIEDPAAYRDYRDQIVEEFAPVYLDGVASNDTKVPEEASMTLDKIRAIAE